MIKYLKSINSKHFSFIYNEGVLLLELSMDSDSYYRAIFFNHNFEQFIIPYIKFSQVTPVYHDRKIGIFSIEKDQLFIFEFISNQISLKDQLEIEIVEFSNGRYFISVDKLFYDNSNTIETPSKKSIFDFDRIAFENHEYGFVFIFKETIIQLNSVLDGQVDRNKFSKLSFETGKKEWDFDLDEHAERIVSAYPFDYPLQIKDPLGVYKDQLWFSMSNYGLLCLENSTGKFLHYFRDCPENEHGAIYLPYGGYPVLPFTENAVLLDKEGKIICFDSMYYWELDLETLQLKYHFLEDYLKESDCYTYGHRFKPLVVEGENVYVVSSQTQKFGCFNRRTLKYDWTVSLPEGSGAPISIEKHGAKLYIETRAKELLVYELEE